MRLNCLEGSGHTLVHPGHSWNFVKVLERSEIPGWPRKQPEREESGAVQTGRPLPAEMGTKVGRATGKHVAIEV